MHMDPVGRNAYDSDFVFYAWIGLEGGKREGRGESQDPGSAHFLSDDNHQSLISI